MSQNETFLLNASASELFGSVLKEASQASKFNLSEGSHVYVLSLLERCIFTETLFGKGSADHMISESLLKALQQEALHKKQKELKFLGESILFKSGFFADSFKRKIVGLTYYIDMGTMAYQSLYEASKNPVYKDLSNRFPGYVDLFSEVAGLINLKSGADLVVLFDRYLEGGPEAARAKLIELGAVPAQNKKASSQ